MIDTTVIAKAPTRFLVSGMGDALSTYFEARATRAAFANVNAGLPCGHREGYTGPAKATNASMAMAELCYRTLLADGLKAKEAVDCNVVTPALENIIEANILLSGIGFESGGLAAAHAIHDGLTILEGTHAYFHGEKVAFGAIAQLALENAPREEMEEVLDFCVKVGLPVCLEDIGVDAITDDEIWQVAEKSCIPEESIHSMPFPVTADSVKAAILTADRIGCKYKREPKGGADNRL
jgi:glycerol dehydrogenase